MWLQSEALQYTDGRGSSMTARVSGKSVVDKTYWSEWSLTPSEWASLQPYSSMFCGATTVSVLLILPVQYMQHQSGKGGQGEADTPFSNLAQTMGVVAPLHFIL